ncbi:hypothetical protein INR49_028918 [Caranx melampygus]|nr:hypothetical protein INR49_028918 [Caranx melampygus]
MSHIVLMAMKKQWTSLILVLVLAHAAKLQMGSQGLSCVNDFVNTVNCTWNSSAVAPGVDCWIEGIKEIFKWLNPLSTSESFFTALPHDHISPVEVCESWDMVPSTSLSTSSTSAHLHFRSFPSAGSITSGVIENSSSSSCFSNMGYFMSEASSSLAGPDPSPAYFSYQDDVHNLHNNHNLSLSLCPSFIASRAYESLKREPQSPDSGFGIGQEDEGDKRDEMDIGVEETSEGHQSSPLLILPLHLSSWVCPPPSVPAAPHPPSLIQICSDIQEVDDEPEAAACESYAAWPVAGSMCRSSSMPVEPCKTGYLTLKELQTTFSNKSI